MNKTNPTGILNAGAWGTAIAKVLGETGIDVVLWDPFQDVVNEINQNHTNSRFLPGIKLPETVRGVTSIEEAIHERKYILVATPSPYLLDITRKLAVQPEIREGKTLIGVLTKGFLPGQNGSKLILDVMENYLPGFYHNNLVYISGPSHAEEVSRGKLTGLLSASSNGKNAIRFRELLSSEYILTYSSLDVIGVQVCAAAKNVIAIAFGILDAMTEISDSMGDNTESLLLAAGLMELQTLGIAMGSSYPETFTSIAGVGDLYVTCKSKHGRNRRFGKAIITDRILSRYSGLEELIEHIHEIGYLPEGIYACKHVHNLVGIHKLHLPLCDAVYRILNKDAAPFDIIKEVISRMI